jgi:hypothetical protein
VSLTLASPFRAGMARGGAGPSLVRHI